MVAKTWGVELGAGWGEVALSESSGHDRNVAKYPTVPTTKNFMAQNVNNVKVEKPWFKIIEKVSNVLSVLLKAKSKRNVLPTIS